ncbi:MAG TPA: L,D-transpeptidase family protein [Chitinophagales bacterium]|nr:L,D-transpeptidase family protein [Chitinophagales bacterium]HMW12613.1 L,D-transpeptidase family protein [Chitinophagales bacterium]HMX59616.1 L,D-transpeptidase family protein [Chitinophagales bacterium]HMY22239.1 L,D-transpeptidase family protein [Chitinophagales bacterium]HMZ33636.1 L,D-transpeptidase family protein [Chitinophagales bacterium]
MKREHKLNSATTFLLFTIFFFCMQCLFTSCKCNSNHAKDIEKKVEAPKDEISFQQDITTILREYIPTLNAIKNDSTKYENWQLVVKEVYLLNNYKSLWLNKDILSPKGKEMLHVLVTAEFLALNKDLYQYEQLQQIYDSLLSLSPSVDFNLAKQLEVGLTRSFLQMALHLDHGMFADTTQGITSNFWKDKNKYIQLLQTAVTDSIFKSLSSLEPNNPLYNRYMSALRAFVAKNNISATPISIRNPKLDSLGALTDARKALVYHHYLMDSLKNNDSAFIVALKRFQKENNLNADGTIGANTIKALERDNSKKFQLLAINADRWRKEHIIELPERYVWVNLPSYRLKIIDHDTLVLEKKVVIGKSNLKNETPILESAINQIVLWPTWSVPQSIIKHEMKSFKGYVVTKNNGWTSVVQPPGPRNALGVVKILFPNKYSVYIHDTPTKSTFGADLRAASHGCVRCQDPLEVVANLMMMDTFKITYDSLIALKDSKIATRTFRLKKPVPVYFRYFTTEADFNGEVKFYSDVYNRDKQLINFIFNGKQAHKLTKEEIRERQIQDSVALIKKKIADSIAATKKALADAEKFIKKDSTVIIHQDSLVN